MLRLTLLISGLMSFLYPTFLYALGAVSIPILIHFLNFYRIKKVEISTIRFLEETKEQRNKWLKLKEWLVLLCRVLAVAFLVFAFAQPFLQGDTSEVAAQEVVFIDNKLSSSITEDDYSVLNQELNLASSHIANAPNGVLFKVITHDFDKDPSYWMPKEQAIEYVNRVTVSNTVNDFKSVVSRAKASLSLQSSLVPFNIYSDYNASYFDEFINNDIQDSVFNYALIPVQSNSLSNLAIDSVWVASPVLRASQENKLFVRLQHYGEAVQKSCNLSFRLNNKLIASFKVDVDGEQEKTKVVSFDFIVPVSGWNAGEITIDDLPVFYDNQFYFTFKALENLNVTLVKAKSSSRSFLPQVYEQESLFNLSVTDLQKPNFEDLKKSDLIILESLEELPTYFLDLITTHRANGGGVVFVPKGNASDVVNLKRLGVLCEQGKDTVFTGVSISDWESGEFSNVFVKQRNNKTVLSAARSLKLMRGDRIMKYKNGLPYLIKNTAENKGSLYVFAAPLSKQYSDIHSKAVVVPLFYNVAFLSSRSQYPLYSYVNSPSYAVANSNTAARSNLSLKLSGGEYDPVYPEQYKRGASTVLNLSECKSEGVYEVFEKDSVQALMALNLPKAVSDVQMLNEESLMAASSRSDLLEVVDIDNSLRYESAVINTQGSSLWKYCLILVLLFLFAEMAIIKFF